MAALQTCSAVFCELRGTMYWLKQIGFLLLKIGLALFLQLFSFCGQTWTVYFLTWRKVKQSKWEVHKLDFSKLCSLQLYNPGQRLKPISATQHNQTLQRHSIAKINRKFQDLWLRYQMILQVHNREKFSRNYFKFPERSMRGTCRHTKHKENRINSFLSGYQEQEEQCFRKHLLEAEKMWPFLCQDTWKMQHH